MEIFEKKVSEANLDTLIGLITIGDDPMSLDEMDVKRVVAGKKGMLYISVHVREQERREFLENHFAALSEKEEVKSATSMLVKIITPDGESLTMEEMDTLDECLNVYAEEDKEVIWGVSPSSGVVNMCVIVLGMREGE